MDWYGLFAFPFFVIEEIIQVGHSNRVTVSEILGELI
jgi:hypothetical protein